MLSHALEDKSDTDHCYDKSFKVISPAKIILSGEYAVLYGKPAIAAAINLYASSNIAYRYHDNSNVQILLHLQNLNYYNSLTHKYLKCIKAQLDNKYRQFLNGKSNIQAVVREPCELLEYAVANILEILQNKVDIANIIKLTVNSEIPIGAGFGSSAAVIINAIFGFNKLFNLNLLHEQILQLAQMIENLQHGRSSGLDLNLVLHGGIIMYTVGRLEKISTAVPINVVFTGLPLNTTGECVAYVKEKVTTSKLFNIWHKFEQVTHEFSQALALNNLPAISSAINKNHILLTQIGVVPKRVQEFIAKLGNIGLAAKVAGAGAISGENAGCVIILGELSTCARDIIKEFKYSYSLYNIDYHGTRVL